MVVFNYNSQLLRERKRKKKGVKLIVSIWLPFSFFKFIIVIHSINLEKKEHKHTEAYYVRQ